MKALTHALFAVTVAALGCERGDAGKPAPRAELPASPATATKIPAAAPREVAFGAEKVRFFVPEGLASAAKPAFVLVLHGLGGGGSDLVAALGLEAFAREKQFMFAAPDGTRDGQGRRFWNANEVCCNFERTDVNDVERLMALVDYAVDSLHADPKRVFLVGYSNGGFMAHRLACEHSQRVRAIVSIAAAGPDPSQPCQPSAAVSVLEIHGDQDSIVPFEGGRLFGRPELPRSPSVRSGLQVWARQAQCAGELVPAQSFDFVAELPGNDTDGFRFSNCRASSPLLWKVKGGGHVIPLGLPALSAIWDFLAAQS